MSYDRIQHSGGAVPTTLAGDITSGATVLNLVSSSGWPDGSIGPFYLVIDPGLATEEKLLATTRTGNTLNTLSRGVDGTSASAHSGGATVVHCFTAVEADEANVAANQTLGLVTTKGDGLAATGNQQLGRVPVGANNTVWMADSAQAAGVKYAKIVAANITAGTITGTEIADAAVSLNKLATDSVSTPKIVASSVSRAKLGNDIMFSGVYSGTTDGNGQLNVVTACPFTPTQLILSPSSPSSGAQQGFPCVLATGTTFTIQYCATVGTMHSVAVVGFYLMFP